MQVLKSPCTDLLINSLALGSKSTREIHRRTNWRGRAQKQLSPGTEVLVGTILPLLNCLWRYPETLPHPTSMPGLHLFQRLLHTNILPWLVLWIFLKISQRSTNCIQAAAGLSMLCQPLAKLCQHQHMWQDLSNSCQVALSLA